MKYIFIILLITGCSSGSNNQGTEIPEPIIIDSITNPLLEITYLLGGGRIQSFAIDDKIHINRR